MLSEIQKRSDHNYQSRHRSLNYHPMILSVSAFFLGVALATKRMGALIAQTKQLSLDLTQMIIAVFEHEIKRQGEAIVQDIKCNSSKIS